MENNNEIKIIFDININSVQDLYNILLNKGYDFVTLEPEEEKVSVKFRKDGKVVDERFIKKSIYSEIIVKAKTISGLDVGVTNEEQEGTGEIEFQAKKYNALTKVVPNNFGEKIFLKLKFIEPKTNSKKEVKPIELGKIVGFFGALLIVLTIVGGSFISFVVFNAQTIDDVIFFHNIFGIDLNELNSFIRTIVNILFGALSSILSIFLAIFLFKFLLTKKIFKKKKTTYGIVSTLLFILFFTSLTAWMAVAAKIDGLQEWQYAKYDGVFIYDNSIYNSKKYENDKNDSRKIKDSIIDEKNSLIGPINLRFDISGRVKREINPGLKIKNYLWDFGGNDTEETIEPILPSKILNRKGNYNIKVQLTFTDGLNQESTKQINIKNLFIQNVVKIEEKERSSGAKTYKFDASELKNLGRVKWYTEDSDVPVDGYIYNSSAIVDEKIITMIVGDLKKEFVIGGEDEGEIFGEIEFEKSPLNERAFTFKVANPRTSEGNGIIEEFIWRIDSKEIKLKGSDLNPEKSSELKHNFTVYKDYEISVELVSTSGKRKTFRKIISVTKELKIKNGLKFIGKNGEIENVKHTKENGEYILNNFGVSEDILKIDARYVKSENPIYFLKDVEWDYDYDGNIDSRGKIGNMKIVKLGSHRASVIYKFQNIKVENDIVEVKENFFIEAVAKEYDIDFKINQNSEYAPAVIGFDASKSFVKDSNISKFIWDFGDGTSTDGDSVIKGHRYLTDGTYHIRLKVITSDGREFSASKKLVLKPKAKKVKIKSSLKEAPVGQGIDFTSSDSIGDIVEYIWDFGDGEKSTEANPSHSYKKAGNYKVKLSAEFRDRNILEDTLEIIITH